MFVAFITAATFLIFFLFKYNYTRCLWAYMGFSGLLIFGVLGAAVGYELIQALGVPLDILTYTFCVYNFSIGGVLAVMVCAFLAATFLAAEADGIGRNDLADWFGRRAMVSAAVHVDARGAGDVKGAPTIVC